jgi:hypothetical protein
MLVPPSPSFDSMRYCPISSPAGKSHSCRHRSVRRRIFVRDHGNGLLQESTHALFPGEGVRYFTAQVFVACAGGLQVGFAFRRRLPASGHQYLHDPFVFFAAAGHCFCEWAPLSGFPVSRSKSQRRARYHSRCMVCKVIPSASAVS